MKSGLKALFLLLVVSILAVAAVSADNEIPGWGRFLDPNQDCDYKLDKNNGKLTIIVPGGAHDLSSEQGQMSAPRVLQVVNGDFTMQAKVAGVSEPEGAVVPGRPPYQGAGLVCGSDAKNYVRLERATFIQFNTNKRLDYANFEIRRNGQVETIGNANDHPLQPDSEVYFKLERRGQRIFGSISQDGERWKPLGSKILNAPGKFFVGVAAINASQATFSPEYSEFKLTTDQQEN